MHDVGLGETVSLVSLGSGEPELIDPDGASSGSQTRVSGVQLKRSRMGQVRGHRPRYLECSQIVVGWGEFEVVDPGVWSAVGA